MAEQHGSRELTRADVLVIAVVCLLLILVVPVLFAQPREGSVRRPCAANLAQIGKAMLLYANDYEDELPRAGGRTTVWGSMPTGGWRAHDRSAAYGLAADGSGGAASISSCFYLLVRYVEVPPRVFICKGDRGTREFKLSDPSGAVLPGYEPFNFWDFGPPIDAFRCCSYAYHTPFNRYALTTSDEPGLAVAADRNPWINSPMTSTVDIVARWPTFMPDVTGWGVSTAGTSEQARAGNALAHQGDGQNVLFLDGHVEFAERAYCSLEKDNVYTVSTLPDRGDIKGIRPTPSPICVPKNRKDSLLVHDPDSFGSRRR
jgi:prepilin-type processing-associated H-X9-DG protein